MKLQWIKSAVARIATAIVVVGCGGGGGGGGIGGTGAPSVSIGTITDFGSVWVNGVEYNSDNATIKRDDDPIAFSASNPLNRKGGLRKGMVARVDGSIDDKVANSVVVKSAAKGRVEATPTATQMVVMGQAIVLDSATNFEDGVRPGLGDYVDVHGLVVSDGTIAAGFVERKAPFDTPPFAVKGFVKNHTAGATTFQIGNLNVTLANGAVINDMPSGSWTGLAVEVKGTACAGNPVCGTLTASKVEPEGVGGDIAKVEFEGFVSALHVDGFNIGAQKVITNGSTTFDGGVAGDLVVGTKVEVEGVLVGGVLTASKVSFRENVRLEANVAAVSALTNTFTLTGLGGITVEVNALTEFSGFTPNGLSGLAPGAHIEVRGRPGAGSNVIATEVKTGGGNVDRVIVQAVASAVSRPSITLLGIVMDTTGATYKDIGDAVISADQFFARAGAGTLIKSRGRLSGGTVTWNDEVQLED